MYIFIDKFALLLLSLLSLLFVPLDSAFVIAFFTAVAFTTLLYAFPDDRFQLAAVTLFSLLVLWRPDFILFLPLLLYDYIPQLPPEKGFTRRLLLRLPAVLLLIGGWLRQWQRTPDLSQLAFLFSGCLFSLLLRIKSMAYAALFCRFLQTRDSDTEIKLLLEEKNRTLREKQDSEIYAATLRERNRIAREIHDNVGHMLTRSILMVGALKTINRNEATAEALSQLEATLNQSMDSVRTSVHDLHDNSINLKETLQTMVREFSYCPVGLDYSISPDVPRDVKYSFISIASEALVNISRHSNATRAGITAAEHPGFYQLIIQDNGTSASPGETPSPGNVFSGGKPGTQTPSAPSGIGLENIRNRVTALNGNLQIRTAPGYRIYITIPKGNNPALKMSVEK